MALKKYPLKNNCALICEYKWIYWQLEYWSNCIPNFGLNIINGESEIVGVLQYEWLNDVSLDKLELYILSDIWYIIYCSHALTFVTFYFTWYCTRGHKLRNKFFELFKMFYYIFNSYVLKWLLLSLKLLWNLVEMNAEYVYVQSQKTHTNHGLTYLKPFAFLSWLVNIGHDGYWVMILIYLWVMFF